MNEKKMMKELFDFLMKHDFHSRVFLLGFITKLMDAGEKVGLPKNLAKELAIYTTIGTIKMLNATKNQVL
jgi:pyrroline-5-carboxylate reductase